MKRRRRKSSEDKKASDSSNGDNSGKGVNGDMRERCEDLIRRIQARRTRAIVVFDDSFGYRDEINGRIGQ